MEVGNILTRTPFPFDVVVQLVFHVVAYLLSLSAGYLQASRLKALTPCYLPHCIAHDVVPRASLGT